MLRELVDTRQVKGEPPRKWFFSHDLDLVVWFDSTGLPCAFQLAYNKYKNEHSISWHHEKGYQHYAVDDGESSGIRSTTPFLYANGPFMRDIVVEQFIALSGELPFTVTEVIVKKLREFNGLIHPVPS